jgi:hypothetical protein
MCTELLPEARGGDKKIEKVVKGEKLGEASVFFPPKIWRARQAEQTNIKKWE